MARLLISVALLTMRVTAQPPPLLQIVQERLKPGAERPYGKIEKQLAQLCARMHCPNPYLALVSIASPKEVIWLNEYASSGDVDRVARAYTDNAQLMAAMRELSQGKKGLTDEPIDRMGKLRPDLSGASAWRIGELRFAAVLETDTPVKSSGAVFQVPGGKALVFSAASDQAEAQRIASGLSREARVFEVRPEWSLPSQTWVAKNPGLWKRR